MKNDLSTRYPVDVVSPGSPFAIPTSPRPSILCEGIPSPRSRCTPAAILNTEHSVSAFQCSISAFFNCKSPPLVVSSQEETFAIQLWNCSAGRVLEATNSLYCDGIIWVKIENFAKEARLHVSCKRQAARVKMKCAFCQKLWICFGFQLMFCLLARKLFPLLHLAHNTFDKQMFSLDSSQRSWLLIRIGKWIRKQTNVYCIYLVSCTVQR